ncbi:MAG: RNA polymerase sigma factor [Saprospiraceae bacterium]|nr:RNA polymerase sigma factor [Lewinella sp.]
MYVSKAICDQFNDIQIVQQALQQIDYFSCLYERYEDRLLRYIKRMATVNHEEAEDILQDAFIKIWRNLNSFDQHLKLSSWIYRIVHNEVVSFWRKKESFGKNRKVEPDDDLFRIDPEESTPDLEELDMLTHEVLELLPLKYKTVLVLKFLEGMSYAEISDVLKKPEGTIATLINRAKKAFITAAGEKHISFV